MARKIRTRAVFHDRTALDHAVRALELEGIRRQRVHIYRADFSEGVVHTPPETGSALVVGAAVGAGIGAALALMAIAEMATLLSPLAIAARAIGSALAGALLGGLFAVVLRRLRNENRSRAASEYRDFLVRVDAPDRVSAEKIRDLLALAGGDPLPD